MNNKHKQLLFIFLCIISISHTVLAGKWVNWNNIAQDIKEGITSAVDFIGGALTGTQTTIINSGNIIKKEMHINNIENIELSGTGNLVISDDNQINEVFIIEADEAIMPHIETTINNKTLSIKIQNNTSYNNDGKSITYYVNIKKISQITLSGATNTTLNSTASDSLTIDASGASNVSGNINIERLAIDSQGASKIVLSGKATTQNIDLSGSSRFDGQNLLGTTITVHASGSSTIHCNASEMLSGKISGASGLYYKNNPIVSVKSTGVASIQKI